MTIKTYLQKSQCIAHSVGLMSGQSWRIYGWINGNDLLEQCRDSPEGVPEHWCQIWNNFPLLAEFQKSTFSGVWWRKFKNPLVNLVAIHWASGWWGRGRVRSLWSRSGCRSRYGRGRQRRWCSCRWRRHFGHRYFWVLIFCVEREVFVFNSTNFNFYDIVVQNPTFYF